MSLVSPLLYPFYRLTSHRPQTANLLHRVSLEPRSHLSLRPQILEDSVPLALDQRAQLLDSQV